MGDLFDSFMFFLLVSVTFLLIMIQLLFNFSRGHNNNNHKDFINVSNA